MKYFYKDADGNEHKYVGKIEEKDGKFFGTLVSSETVYETLPLTEVESSDVVDKELTYLVWKDKFGIEHELTNEHNVKDNQVVDKRVYELKIDYHPEVLEKAEFIRKDNKQLFEGEIIEKNGKFFGK